MEKVITIPTKNLSTLLDFEKKLNEFLASQWSIKQIASTRDAFLIVLER